MVYRQSDARLQALLEAGLGAHRQGDLDRALAAYREILSATPDHGGALRLLGTALLQLGEPAEAASYLERALIGQRRDPELLANLAQAYLALQRYADAAESFRKASRLAPDNVQLQIGIAAALAMDGELAQAEKVLARQAKRAPDNPLVWLNLGNIFRDTRRPDEAIRAYRRALALDASMVEARNSLGSVLHSLLRFSEAETEYRACIEAAPDFILPVYNLASVTMDVGRFAEAESIARGIVERAPNVAEGHRVVGIALVHQGRLLEALPWYRRSAQIAPDSPPAARAYGIALLQTGQPGAGLRWLAHAAAIASDDPAADQSTSSALLAHGAFSEGWRAYANRSAATDFRERNPGVELAPSLPVDLEQRRVCVLAEQGLGDQLFFLRYTTSLAARGASVIHRAEPKLHTLLERVGSLREIVHHDAALPAADWYVLAGDLPRMLGELPSSALSRAGAGVSAGPLAEPARYPSVFWPALPPTLRIEPLAERVEQMRARLSALGDPPYIGLTWRAGTAPEKQRAASWLLYKSISLQDFASGVTNLPGTLLALQREADDAEIETLSSLLSRPVHDSTSLNDDLEGMLALLAILDEYIGVSNTNMHLRAAAGRTARVLVPAPAEWRWMDAGRESPWFPGFPIYRQSVRGDWSAALAALAHDLETQYGSR